MRHVVRQCTPAGFRIDLNERREILPLDYKLREVFAEAQPREAAILLESRRLIFPSCSISPFSLTAVTSLSNSISSATVARQWLA